MLCNSLASSSMLQQRHAHLGSVTRLRSPCRNKVRASCRRPDDVGTKDWESLMTAKIRPTELFASDYAVRAFEPEKMGCNPDGSPVTLTVYSIRMETSMRAGAGLSSMSAVNVLLVSADGRSVLHRISPVRDPEEDAKCMENICNAVSHIDDPEVGANCLVINAMQRATHASNKPGLRFQVGAVDEVSFLAPDLGTLTGILVGVESGTWVVDEVHVSSSRSKDVCRFVCRQALGSKPNKGAAWLTPVPQDAVVYSFANDSIIVNKYDKEQMAQIAPLVGQPRSDMIDYEILKATMLLSSFFLSAGGTAVAHILGGAQAAWPFATGGFIGLSYLWLLQQGVDSLDLSTSKTSDSDDLWVAMTKEHDHDKHFVSHGSSSDVVTGFTSSPIWRLSMVAGTAYLALAVAFHQEARQACETVACASAAAAVHGHHYSAIVKFALGVLGFMTYKAAVVGTALSPISPPVLVPTPSDKVPK